MKRAAGSILLISVLSLALGACGDSTTTSGDSQLVAGVYALKTVDGHDLPGVVDQSGNDTAEITQGNVVLDESLLFNDLTDLRLTTGGVVTTQTEGTAGFWGVNGTTIQFQPNDGSAFYTMTWDRADQLTQLFNGHTLVYQR